MTEQQRYLAEARLKTLLERRLAAQGWPEKARDYALEEVMNTPAAQSHVRGGAPAPDADELASAVFATARGAQLKALIDEAGALEDAAKTNSPEGILAEIAQIENPVARITAARRAGLA